MFPWLVSFRISNMSHDSSILNLKKFIFIHVRTRKKFAMFNHLDTIIIWMTNLVSAVLKHLVWRSKNNRNETRNIALFNYLYVLHPVSVIAHFMKWPEAFSISWNGQKKQLHHINGTIEIVIHRVKWLIHRSIWGRYTSYLLYYIE